MRHTYTVAATRYGKGPVTGNEFYITRRFGKDIWDYFGEVVDHAADCRCLKGFDVTLPPDPWGTPDLGPAPF